MSRQRSTAGDVDWEALRRRLDDARLALDGVQGTDSSATRKVLSQRAAKLAQPEVRDEQSGAVDLLVFRLGRETCAIDGAIVLNVFRLAELARLPGAAVPVYGVTLWRGEIITVLDLRPLLGLSTTVLSDLGRVIVVGRDRAAFGFLADSVSGILATLPQDIHPRAARSGQDRGLVQGITSDAVIVLDPEQVLRLANPGV